MYGRKMALEWAKQDRNLESVVKGKTHKPDRLEPEKRKMLKIYE